MAATFQTVPTANPNESAIVLTVDDFNMKPEDMPVRGTSYEDWRWGQKDKVRDGWGGYIFAKSVDAANGKRAFLFVKAKTLDEAKVPFETYWTNVIYRWPAVLLDLGFYQVPNQTQGLNALDAYRERIRLKPSVEVSSRVKVELFLGNEAFPPSMLRHRQPILDDVFWDIQGSSRSIRDCLHPEFTVRDPGIRGELDYESGTPSRNNTNGDTIFFPATNFTDWQAFVLSDRQQVSEGQYLREKQTIYPPTVDYSQNYRL